MNRNILSLVLAFIFFSNSSYAKGSSRQIDMISKGFSDLSENFLHDRKKFIALFSAESSIKEINEKCIKYFTAPRFSYISHQIPEVDPVKFIVERFSFGQGQSFIMVGDNLYSYTLDGIKRSHSSWAKKKDPPENYKFSLKVGRELVRISHFEPRRMGHIIHSQASVVTKESRSWEAKQIKDGIIAKPQHPPQIKTGTVVSPRNAAVRAFDFTHRILTEELSRVKRVDRREKSNDKSIEFSRKLKRCYEVKNAGYKALISKFHERLNGKDISNSKKEAYSRDEVGSPYKQTLLGKTEKISFSKEFGFSISPDGGKLFFNSHGLKNIGLNVLFLNENKLASLNVSAKGRSIAFRTDRRLNSCWSSGSDLCVLDRERGFAPDMSHFGSGQEIRHVDGAVDYKDIKTLLKIDTRNHKISYIESHNREKKTSKILNVLSGKKRLNLGCADCINFNCRGPKCNHGFIGKINLIDLVSSTKAYFLKHQPSDHKYMKEVAKKAKKLFKPNAKEEERVRFDQLSKHLGAKPKFRLISYHFSPHGKKVAFSVERTASGLLKKHISKIFLFVRDMNDSAKTEFISSNVIDHYHWSPDSSKLYFLLPGGIVYANIE